MKDRLEILRAAYSEGKYTEAVKVYRTLTEGGEVSPEAHFLGAMSLRKSGDLYGARRALERGLEGEPEENLWLKLLLTLGETCRQIGDIPAAIAHLTRFLQGVEAVPELAQVARGAGLFNLALSYRQGRRLWDSIHTYEMAIAEFRREGMSDYLRRALQNIAWVKCSVGDAEGAEAALDEAEHLLATPDSRYQQALGRTYSAFMAGVHVVAVRQAVHLTSSTSDVPADVKAHAYWLLGRVALAQGRTLDAESLANEAIRIATESTNRDSRCLTDASDLLIEIRNREREGANNAQNARHMPVGDDPCPDAG